MLDLRRCTRLVVYGGTFDPPHRAHVVLPQHAAGAVTADGLLYVPAGRPPHKSDRTPTEAHHRLAMLHLALADQPDTHIVTCELDRDGPSYTVDTLEHLRDELGDGVELHLLIGADMARIFDQWHKPARIIELAEPLVMLRPPSDRAALIESITSAPAKQRWWARHIVDVPQIEVSSSDLRRRLAERGVGDELVHRMLRPAVRQYIESHRLYRRDR